MELKNIVISLEISRKLSQIGFNARGVFCYKKNQNNHLYISETDFGKDEFLGYAYTSEELMDYLPAVIRIKEGIYVANQKSYDFIGQNNINESFPYAEAFCSKIPEFIENKERYCFKYVYQHRMVAFSQNLEGKYNNLIVFGENEADCRGNMLLTLIEQNLL